MRSLGWFALVLAPVLLLSAACGSDDSGGAGGAATGGVGGTATGGSGGGATGGTGGSATGGAAGSATGGTGGSATGGAAGSATGGAAGSGTGGSAGSGPDIGTCTTADGNPGTIGGTQCHQLPNCAADVEFQTAAGTAPTPAGGTFVDGLYALTAVKVYGTAAPPGVIVKVTQYKQGDTVYSAASANGSEGARRVRSP